jgi:CheY-like chemotaxis protein
VQPDALLLDVSMDDLDGWHTARAVRAAGWREVPIIMVSANVFDNRPDKLASADCQAFVAKPVIESELLDVLARHLHLNWVRGDLRRALVEADVPLPVADRQPGQPLVALPGTPDGQDPHRWWQRVDQMARRGELSSLQRCLDDEAACPLPWREHLMRWRRLAHDLDFVGLQQALAHVRPQEDTDDVSCD